MPVILPKKKWLPGFVEKWGPFTTQDFLDTWAAVNDVVTIFQPPAGSTAGQIIYVAPGSPLTIGATNLAGDVTGTVTNTAIEAIQGQALDVTTVPPTDGQALVWNNTASQWEAQTVGGSTTFASQPTTDAGTVSDEAIAPLTLADYKGWKHNNLKYITPSVITGPAIGADYNNPYLFSSAFNLVQVEAGGNYVILEPGTYTQNSYVIGVVVSTSTYDGRDASKTIVTAAKVELLSTDSGSLDVVYKNITFDCTAANLEFSIQKAGSVTFENCRFAVGATTGLLVSDLHSSASVTLTNCSFIGGASTGAIVVNPVTFMNGVFRMINCNFRGSSKKTVTAKNCQALIFRNEFNSDITLENNFNLLSYFSNNVNSGSTVITQNATFGITVTENSFENDVTLTTTGDGNIKWGQNTSKFVPIVSGNLNTTSYLDIELESSKTNAAYPAGTFLSISSGLSSDVNSMGLWSGLPSRPITGILIHTQTDAGSVGLVLKRGYYLAPGIDLSAQVFGQPVWVNSAGALVLVPGESNILVGYVINPGTGIGDGTIYFDYRFQNLRNSYAFAVPTTAPTSWSTPISHGFANQFVNVQIVETASGTFENVDPTLFNVRRDSVNEVSVYTAAGVTLGDILVIVTR